MYLILNYNLNVFNYEPKIICNSVSLKLGPSHVVYSRYIVTVVLFEIELAYSTIFWDLTSIFNTYFDNFIFYINWIQCFNLGLIYLI